MIKSVSISCWYPAWRACCCSVSKGFADCVVSIGEGRADITVMTENDALTADEVTRIRDAVLGKCKGLSAQDITVVEVR